MRLSLFVFLCLPVPLHAVQVPARPSAVVLHRVNPDPREGLLTHSTLGHHHKYIGRKLSYNVITILVDTVMSLPYSRGVMRNGFADLRF